MISEAVEENTRTTNEMNNTAVSVSSIMVKAVPYNLEYTVAGGDSQVLSILFLFKVYTLYSAR